MPDLKRTIRALEVCTSGVQSDLDCTDCPYHDDCENHPMRPMMEMLKDALALLKEHESELIRLREKAENVVVKSSYTLQPFKYRLENATDVESSEFIRANLQRDLIQACEKMGLIAYEKNETKMHGSSPIVKITATLRVHRPEVMKQDG